MGRYGKLSCYCNNNNYYFYRNSFYLCSFNRSVVNIYY